MSLEQAVTCTREPTVCRISGQTTAVKGREAGASPTLDNLGEQWEPLLPADCGRGPVLQEQACGHRITGP